VPAGIAEHFDKKVGHAIGNLGVVPEVRHGVDHAQHLYHEIHAIERAERSAGRREQLQSDQPRTPVTFIDRYLGPHFAC
jgi:hypothetical protein